TANSMDSRSGGGAAGARMVYSVLRRNRGVVRFGGGLVVVVVVPAGVAGTALSRVGGAAGGRLAVVCRRQERAMRPGSQFPPHPGPGTSCQSRSWPSHWLLLS